MMILVIALALSNLSAYESKEPQLPLNAIRYFNNYENKQYWDGWGSATYPKDQATIVNKERALPITTIDGKSCLIIDVKNPEGDPWSVYFKVSGNCLNLLRVGKRPAIRLRFKPLSTSAEGIALNIGCEGAELPLKKYAMLKGGWIEAIVPTDDFMFMSPKIDYTRVWAIYVSSQTKHADSRRIAISSIDLLPSATDLKYRDFIKVDQVGYLPEMNKEAIVSYERGSLSLKPTEFEVIDKTGIIIQKGNLKQRTSAKEWDNDGDDVYVADFSNLKKEGSYRVRVKELDAVSEPFAISKVAYDKLWRDSLRYFYYNRSAERIVEPYGEGFTRPGSHLANTKATYAGKRDSANFDYGDAKTRDVAGGWFDAGDTHANVPCTGIACWYLLETYRDHAKKVGSKSLNLPESTKAKSDLVPLAMHGLKWMRKMQNPDGSVHHYVIGPDQAKEQTVGDTSSQAAAIVAGTFAKAVAVLGKDMPEEQAKGYLGKAKLSWKWLKDHPQYIALTSPDGSDISWWTGGAKAKIQDTQYRAYAAVQLYEATGEMEYREYFEKLITENGPNLLDGPVLGWNMTGYGEDKVMQYIGFLEFGFLDYIKSKREKDKALEARLKELFIHQADVALKYLNQNAYGALLLYPGHLYWGSNGGVQVPLAIVLLRSADWTDNTKYRQAATNAIHFIFGRNPVNRVFVSGYGVYEHGSDFYSNYWNDLKHQPPGVLGGNIHVDGSAKHIVEYPYKRFINTQDADMTEPGVYWNSAFSYLLGFYAASAGR